MSVKIKLIMDTIPDKTMERYVSNDSAYRIRDELHNAMLNYEKDIPKEEIDKRFYDDVVESE